MIVDRPFEDNSWVKTDLVMAPLHAQNAFEAITLLGSRLYAAGYVRESFVSAVIEREKKFATGLPTVGIQVAIPHTDVEHVLRDGIAVGVLDSPVTFGEMGNPEGTVEAQIICLLAATRADQVVTLLQNLADMFQNPEALQQIVAAKDVARIAAIFNSHLRGFLKSGKIAA